MDAAMSPLRATLAAGAGGTIAANKVAKASNDGYTLLRHHIGLGTAPSRYRTLP
jgi:tripartite-type tricarboxylate transporter receptor subunit TctC